jgi:hypothetical protein
MTETITPEQVEILHAVTDACRANGVIKNVRFGQIAGEKFVAAMDAVFADYERLKAIGVRVEEAAQVDVRMFENRISLLNPSPSTRDVVHLIGQRVALVPLSPGPG